MMDRPYAGDATPPTFRAATTVVDPLWFVLAIVAGVLVFGRRR
jgi:hypothetical protein